MMNMYFFRFTTMLLRMPGRRCNITYGEREQWPHAVQTLGRCTTPWTLPKPCPSPTMHDRRARYIFWPRGKYICSGLPWRVYINSSTTWLMRTKLWQRMVRGSKAQTEYCRCCIIASRKTALGRRTVQSILTTVQVYLQTNVVKLYKQHDNK